MRISETGKPLPLRKTASPSPANVRKNPAYLHRPCQNPEAPARHPLIDMRAELYAFARQRPHSLRRRFPYRNRHGLHKATRSTGRLPDFPEFPSRKSAGNPRHCCGFRRRSRPAPRKREPEHRAAKRSAAGRTPSFRSARKRAAGPGRKRRKSGRNRTPAPCKPTGSDCGSRKRQGRHDPHGRPQTGEFAPAPGVLVVIRSEHQPQGPGRDVLPIGIEILPNTIDPALFAAPRRSSGDKAARHTTRRKPGRTGNLPRLRPAGTGRVSPPATAVPPPAKIRWEPASPYRSENRPPRVPQAKNAWRRSVPARRPDWYNRAWPCRPTR